ncbi:MAG TPA: tetratricopeptide repeat protein, partial [Actinospica sp.]|nr:tetratricopeptide repeat protein [Actinospica sp.]
PAALRLAALCQSALGRHEAAVATGRAAVAADPDSEHARRILAHIHYKTGELRPAAAIAQEAVRLAPEEWRGHMLLARCLCHFDPQRALGPAERSRVLAPASAETHFTCALVYQALGRRQEARAAYHRVLELNPQHAMAHNNLAVLDRFDRRWDTALRGFRRSLSSDPHQVLARRNIEAILLARVWRLTSIAIIGVIVLDTFAPVLGGLGQRLLGLAVLAVLGGSVAVTVRQTHRAAGPAALRMLRADRLVLVCAGVIAAALVFSLVAGVLRLFTITDQYTSLNLLITLLLCLLVFRVRSRTRRSARLE